MYIFSERGKSSPRSPSPSSPRHSTLAIFLNHVCETSTNKINVFFFVSECMCFTHNTAENFYSHSNEYFKGNGYAKKTLHNL